MRAWWPATKWGRRQSSSILAAYALTDLGAFGVIALIGSRERANDDLRDYVGLWHTHPALASLMTFFLLSLGRDLLSVRPVA